MQVDENSAAAQHDYDETTYYFCSTDCGERFEESPQKYLTDTALPASPSPADQKAIYTCPMDPEVRQHGPGPCPKCGMALEARIAATAHAPNPELEDMQRRFKVGVALSVPLLILAMTHMIPGGPIAGIPALTTSRIQAAWTL